MSSAPDTIESYISKTLTAEQQAAEVSKGETFAGVVPDDQELRTALQAALDRDDKKAAIKIAYVLMDDNGEDSEFDILYDFLLTRVGVETREPVFSMSLSPVIQWASGICIAVPMIFLVSSWLSPEQVTGAGRTDVLSCIGAALVFGVPLWDLLFAKVYNHVNRYRLLR